MKLITILFAAAAALVAVAPAAARDAVVDVARQIVPLKDGGTLFIFKDGKMAKEDKVGRAVFLKHGEVLDTADGRQLTVGSNEVGRLDLLLKQGHQN